jgi:hypothetical protein
MKRRLILLAILLATASVCVFPSVAPIRCSSVPLQDSPSSQSQAPPQRASDHDTPSPDSSSPAERKKNKKVWTNDNLDEVRGSTISQVGVAKNSPPANSSVAKPPSPQAVAALRKELATLQAQLSNVEKQIADMKSFSKGESPGQNGLQVRHRYTTESVEDQLRKLEEKRKLLAAKMDEVLEVARKQGIEPGQLR